MKKRLQGLVAGVLIGATITGGVVFATTGTKTIEVLYNNIKVYKDNVLCELKDANGTVVEPFIYNGTTYMPVRGTANLAGMDVEWEGETQSVYLWDEMSGEEVFLMDVCPPYETGSFRDESFYMAGEKYSNGFYSWFYEQDAYFNLNGKYSELNCVIGHLDGHGSREKTVSFYIDGKKVKEVDVFEGDMPKKVTVPLNYGLQLKIHTNVNGQDYKVGIGNITVK